VVISRYLQQLCTELDKFQIATAIGHTSTDKFVRWNRSFADRLGLTDAEMKQAELGSVIVADATTSISSQVRDAPPPGPFVDCVIRTSSGNQQIGRSVQREDGFILVILDDISGHHTSEEYAKGYLAGQEAELQRSRRIVHNDISGNLIAASFAAENAKEKLEQEGRPEAKDLKQIADLIDQVINDLVKAFTAEPPIIEQE
jgi:PAS domain-containing protein